MIDLFGIKNIVLDLGGVILNINYQKTASAFKQIGFQNFDDFYSQKTQTSLFDLLETGKINTSEFVKGIQTQSPNLTEASIISAWNAMLLDLPIQRIELIRELAKSYRVFLLSNTNAIHLEAFTNIIHTQHGEDMLTPCFEKVYYSHEIKHRKPTLECFEYVLNDAGILAEETLFLDDSFQHIEGANACGINTYFVDVKNREDIISLFPDTIL